MSPCGSARWLWLLVLAQLAIPSRYYTFGDDPEDERFAWRMFSSVRFRSCEVSAFEVRSDGEQPVALRRALHASWVGSMRRGRRRVIESFLARRCVNQEIEAAVLLRGCQEVDGRRLARQRYTYNCRTGRLDAAAAEPSQ